MTPAPDKIHRILWAVDPFCRNKYLQRRAVKVIRSLIDKHPALIEPVYVHSPQVLALPLEAVPFFLPNSFAIAEKKLNDFLNTLQLPGLMTPIFLSEPTGTMRNAVEKLLDHARATQSEVIVVSSSLKKGIDRMMMGSFVETLLLHSDIPTIVVSPKTQIEGTISQVLFPTDFSDASKEIYEKVVRFAWSIGARVVLFHKVMFPTSYLFPYYPSEEVIRENTENARNLAETWTLDAGGAGVEVEVCIDDEAGEVSDGILKQAKKMHSGVIAMASQSGPVLSSILGSVTRNVVRNASCPVWAIHVTKHVARRKAA